MAGSTPRDYQLKVRFDAPLRFVFDWCTDYSDRDPKLEGESYTRRILERRARRVVYEDLDESKSGWMWSHWTVTLRPPNGWDGRAVGSHRNWTLRYRLRAVSPEETELTLRGRRTPAGIGGPNPSRRSFEKGLAANWAHFRAALEADYRRSLRTPR